ncbi:MAG: HipA domain-containing protein [Ignavibacteria bacterium]|nr:HipA domain-containing protein [Ignavibacteria bacterium]
MGQREIYVFADWVGLEEPTLMGILRTTPAKGKEIFSFEYTSEWLKSENTFLLDPDLNFYTGPQYLSDSKPNFGVFLDSSPDRWGRMLMQRREAILAREENRKENTLFESDYLLGVFDQHRMGALRFKKETDGKFLDNNKHFASPPWTSLRELEQASLHIEKDDVQDNSNYKEWLYMLIAPGSSLGGARPKASVVDPDKNLWIAKFPSANDDRDIGGWAMVVYELGKMSNLNIAEAQVLKLSDKYHTFLTKRFDRTDNNKRIHFASAMTMLGLTDGADAKEGASYIQLAEFLSRNGAKANIEIDLEELWRRIVFNICITNTDDHLRNHGFLLTKSGWILSPAYDLNPVDRGTGLSLNISETDNSLSLDLAMDVIKYFRVRESKASEIIKTVKESVTHWQDIAKKYCISRGEQEKMYNAFWKD